MARYETTADCINAVASEVLSLATPIADPWSSVDPAIVKLRQLLTQCGRELEKNFNWEKLQRTHSITTDGVEDEYLFPEDFSRMLNQTGWNPTERLPLGGPLSPQDYAYLVNTNLAASTIYICFRVSKGIIQFLPDPPPVTSINFIYQSRYWIGSDADTPTADKATAADQYILFDPLLISKFLKLRYLESIGFDTTAAANQFINAWNAITGQDKPSPILSLTRNRVFPYINWRNIPETGFGQP